MLNSLLQSMMRLTIMVLMMYCLQMQISNADVMNVTVALPSNTQAATTISNIVTQTSLITNQPDFFQDKEAVNTLIALMIAMLTAMTTMTGMMFSYKGKLSKVKQHVSSLQNSALPQYNQYWLMMNCLEIIKDSKKETTMTMLGLMITTALTIILLKSDTATQMTIATTSLVIMAMSGMLVIIYTAITPLK